MEYENAPEDFEEVPSTTLLLGSPSTEDIPLASRPSTSSAAAPSAGSSKRRTAVGAGKRRSYRPHISPLRKHRSASVSSTSSFTSRVLPSSKMVRLAFLLLISGGSIFGLSRISTQAVVAKVSPVEDIAMSYPLHTIEALDGSIRASFIELGATLQSLYVKDKHGRFRDVVLGYDDISRYGSDPNHPYFGAVVGRYANRIKNSTFAIPPQQSLKSGAETNGERTIYHVTPNENNGRDTLHGGTPGWDRRRFQVHEKKSNSIILSFTDQDGYQGFPGTVQSRISYELEKGAKWKVKMTATAGAQTPIMLSSHTYWNLDAYEDGASAREHFLQFHASRYVKTDGILIPSGELGEVAGTPYDFGDPRTVASRLNETEGYCGMGCQGYDTSFIYSKRKGREPALQLWSPSSGIKLVVTTNQPAVQIYTCNGIHSKNASNPPIPRKQSQGGPNAFYENHSCIVIEQEDPIDAVNNPQWGYDAIYGPHRTYDWEALHSFSVLSNDG